jgi:hypothetical protein
MIKFLPALALCLGCACPAILAESKISVAQVVANGTPADIEISPQIAGPNSCSAVLSTFSDGTPRLVAAAYNNGVFGHLRMLSVDPKTVAVTVLADVGRPQYLLAGSACIMTLVDLRSPLRKDADKNGDDHRQLAYKSLEKVIQIDFPNLSGHNDASWFFQWTGSTFVNLGPTFTNPGFAPETVFVTAGPMDLDHDGVAQIVSVGEGSVIPDEETGIADLPPSFIWRFNGGSFVPDRTLTEIASFRVSQEQPAQIFTDVTPDTCFPLACREFDLLKPVSSYTLKVINGNADGSGRVRKGHILLNNIEVVLPTDFARKPEFITKTVTLLQKNTLLVSIDGDPDDNIIVTIEPIPPQKPPLP